MLIGDRSWDKPRVSGEWHARDLVDMIGEVGVPTIHRLGPYRFFFYSDENRETFEPPHIHVERDDNKAKFWLEPVRLENSGGFGRNEINRIQRLVEDNRTEMLGRWNEYFNG